LSITRLIIAAMDGNLLKWDQIWCLCKYHRVTFMWKNYSSYHYPN
jgi:hypothetical protein